MKITIVCEGKTEQAFQESLRDFLTTRLAGNMPAMNFDVHNGSIPTDRNTIIRLCDETQVIA